MKKLYTFLSNLFNGKRDSSNDDFIDAADAYLKSTYNKQYTEDELKDKVISDIKKQIKSDVKLNRVYISVFLYSGFREKKVLPEVAEYFKTRNYVVNLLNDENYSNTNVLIINWQNNNNFRS